MQDPEMSKLSDAVFERLVWRTDLPAMQVHGRVAERRAQVTAVIANNWKLRFRGNYENREYIQMVSRGRQVQQLALRRH
jgi:hypothetical protein